MITILLIIGILSLVVGYLVYYRKQISRPKKISWVLLFVPLVIGIWVIWDSFGLKIPLDVRFVEFSARSLRYYPSWIEEIQGHEDSIVTETYSVSHPEYFSMTYFNEKGEISEKEIPRSTYEYYENLWSGDSFNKNGISKRIIRRKFIETIFTGNYKNALIYTKTESYVNYFKNVLSLYDYEIVSTREAEDLGLYQRSRVDAVNSEGILEPRQSLIYGIDVPDNISRGASYMSSLHPNFRPILVVWTGKGNKEQLIKKQRSYWKGGKDNEVVFCVCINNLADQDILWSGSFSWASNHDFEDFVTLSSLQVGSKLDMNKYLDKLEEGYNSGLWIPRDFSSYSVASMPLFQFIYILLGVLLILGDIVLLIKVFRAISNHISHHNHKN